MEQNDRELERTLSDNEWKELIKNVDSETKSPVQRSDRVLQIIRKEEPDISLYDLWCFAVHILQSLIAEYPKAKLPLAILNSLIYQLHYRLRFYKQADN